MQQRFGYKRLAAITTIFAGFAFLFTPTASGAAPLPADCKRVLTADQAVCRQVYKQHAYGWTDNQGTPLNWVPDGRVKVREITHDSGLTKEEMGAYLRGEAASYRAWVTGVSFNLDDIARTCGHKHGSGSVKYVIEGGRAYTFKLVACD